MNNLHPRLQALEANFTPSPLTQIFDDVISAQQVEFWIKRDDLLHPIVSGNKWRKLKYILNHALMTGADTLVSMGGPYSNHLHALGYVGKQLGIKTIAYVRGEQPAVLNPTLLDLQKWDMELRFVSRDEFRQLRIYKNCDIPDLRTGQYWLPEGGAAELALQGVAEIIREIPIDYDHLMVACGTGTTLAGLIASVPAHCKVSGVAALKGADFLNDDIKRLLPSDKVFNKWYLLHDYHFGGFAKSTTELQHFMQQFVSKHAVPLEPIYTGKLLFAVFDLLEQGYFQPGDRIMVLHTGGLQGARGV